MLGPAHLYVGVAAEVVVVMVTPVVWLAQVIGPLTARLVVGVVVLPETVTEASFVQPLEPLVIVTV